MNLLTNIKALLSNQIMRTGLLFLLLISPVFSFGQVASSVRTGNSLPAACKGGNAQQPTDVFITISGGLGTLNICRQADTWVAVPFSGSGTPGGSNGQVQFNNGGVFGGFTINGDGTLNTSTGVLTITKSNGSSFGTMAFQPITNFLAIAGGTMAGKLNTLAASATGAGFNLSPGTAPTTPSNGDLWMTSAGLFGRVNGVTIQFGSGGGTTSPGGSANQIQYNAAGAFGGFTLSGDCTIATIPTIVCTGSNGTPFGTMAFQTASNYTPTSGLGTMAFQIASNYTPTSGLGTGAFATIANYLALAGGTMTGKLNLASSTSGTAMFNCPQATAPTSPANGDIWCTASGLFVQIAGVTYNVTSANVTNIANGTITVNPGAIASGACSSTITQAASGVLTTDNVLVDFNSDPTSTVGYQPTTSGMLTLFKWPTANNVNIKVCNNTSSSVTPGSIVVNYSVKR
jgi:hypothetical protein